MYKVYLPTILIISLTVLWPSMGQAEEGNVFGIPSDEVRPEWELTIAAADGRLDDVKALLDSGADINSKAFGGWTPLHEASSRGHADMVRLLLSYGAHVNIKSAKGRTPLWEALHNRYDKVAEILREHGGRRN